MDFKQIWGTTVDIPLFFLQPELVSSYPSSPRFAGKDPNHDGTTERIVGRHQIQAKLLSNSMVRSTRKAGIVIASFPLGQPRYCRRQREKYRRKLEICPSLTSQTFPSFRSHNWRSFLYCRLYGCGWTPSVSWIACVRHSRLSVSAIVSLGWGGI